jgi:uncharacterized protein YjaG (DUF416 family)
MTERIYHGKSEEIPVIGNYLLSVLKEDFPEFMAYLPKVFTDEFIPGFEKKITEVNNLLNPQEETVALKNTTAQLYSTMDSLKELANKVSGYLKFTKGVVPVSAKDFGLTPLKQKAHVKDAEGVLKYLRIVINNLQKYRQQLTEHGLTEEVIQSFSQAVTSIENENQKQFEILNKRKKIVDNNIHLINDLYKTIMEICYVGKTLYKGKNDLKVKDYTYSELKKKVRNK